MSRDETRRIPAVWIVVTVLFGALSFASSSPPNLYQRLGGYDAIAAVVDDFAPRLIQDAQLGRFFTGLSQDSIRRIRQHLVDFVCQATGGPCYYFGRDMKTSHTGLGSRKATGTAWSSFSKSLWTSSKFLLKSRKN